MCGQDYFHYEKEKDEMSNNRRHTVGAEMLAPLVRLTTVIPEPQKGEKGQTDERYWRTRTQREVKS